MRLFSRIPVQRKLRLIILATCTIALCVASGAFLALQLHFFKSDYRADLEGVAGITAQSAAVTLMADSSQGTQRILHALNAKPHVVGALVRLPDGGVASRFGHFNDEFLNAPMTEGFQTRAGELIYVQPVSSAGMLLATLYLISDYRTELLRFQKRCAGILVVVLAISSLVAVLAGSRLERFISEPIYHLAEMARRIGARNDYSLRAVKFAEDELGEFTDCFNQMLSKIENRDSALRYEIAERARAEQDLQRAQQALMDNSRQEGMADVATCVLHNVGNVLNSVNVSATLISESLNLSRIENLVKASELLRDNQHALEAFLSGDPKGRLLPEYLAQASEQLVAERSVVLDEIALLHKNIDHIKEIVAMQQRYARSSGIIQKFAIADLVEDALRMNQSAFEHHQVIVVREFQMVPPVEVDKHKVLQVLINLIRNARYALDDAAPQKKRLTLRIQQPANEPFVEIAVDDNGIGIGDKNLTKIFSHGFTTRTDGHGFGLHSGAIAAQQMGGRLTVYSAGHLRGATFTLRLPLIAPK